MNQKHTNKNLQSSYLNALKQSNTQAPPIWFMRQAGRYLPEYREIRKHYSFTEMISTPDIVTEITLQPIKRYQFDAAILYSDILVVPNAFGLHFDFIEKKGPVLRNQVNVEQLKERLSHPYDISTCDFVFQSIIQLTEALSSYNTPLIGFAGCPFTVACYLIEGHSSKIFSSVRELFSTDPDTMHFILQRLTDASIDYLTRQLDAGVDAIQLFDTWACLLTPSEYRDFSLHYIQQICDALTAYNKPIILFSKHSQHFVEQQLTLPIDAISIDAHYSLEDARKKVGKGITLQGNLNPELLLGDVSTLEFTVKSILNTMKNDPAYIFNLGHGILPPTPLDNVQRVVDLVKHA